MNKITIVIFFTLLLFACGKEIKTIEQNDSETKLENESTSLQKNILSNPIVLSLHEIPSEINFKGKIKNAIKWTDLQGENIVITTETGIYENPHGDSEHEGSADAELFAYHYLNIDDSFVQTWKVYDFISDCPVDIVAEYIDNTFQITDLDKNGIAEIWLMYEIVCHGDVSPTDMKIIMYEGNQKYAIRGESKVMIGIDDNDKKLYFGGEYKVDSAFLNGPIVFLEFAKKMWDSNLIETDD